MPDSPDYSKYLPGSARYSLSDLSELAARLNSPNAYDRRGEVAYQTTFESGFSGWDIGFNGTGGKVKVSANGNYRWPYNMCLLAPTTSWFIANVELMFSVWTTNRIGIEYAIAIPTVFSKLIFTLTGLYSNIAYLPIIQYLSSAKQLQYYGEDSAYHTFSTFPGLDRTRYCYLPYKLVVDLSTGKYVRLLISNSEFDLSAYSMYHYDSTAANYIKTTVQFHGQSSPQAEAHIGHMIFTVNEP